MRSSSKQSNEQTPERLPRGHLLARSRCANLEIPYEVSGKLPVARSSRFTARNAPMPGAARATLRWRAEEKKRRIDKQLNRRRLPAQRRSAANSTIRPSRIAEMGRIQDFAIAWGRDKVRNKGKTTGRTYLERTTEGDEKAAEEFVSEGNMLRAKKKILLFGPRSNPLSNSRGFKFSSLSSSSSRGWVRKKKLRSRLIFSFWFRPPRFKKKRKQTRQKKHQPFPRFSPLSLSANGANRDARARWCSSLARRAMISSVKVKKKERKTSVFPS